MYPGQVAIIKGTQELAVHGTRLGFHISIELRMPDMPFIAREFPERETEDIESIFTHHTFMVENCNIPEGLNKAPHLFYSCVQVWDGAAFIS
jgi:hypothetical protein